MSTERIIIVQECYGGDSILNSYIAFVSKSYEAVKEFINKRECIKYSVKKNESKYFHLTGKVIESNKFYELLKNIIKDKKNYLVYEFVPEYPDDPDDMSVMYIISSYEIK